MPQLLQVMSPRKSLLIVTWDEGDYESATSSLVATIFAGNAAKLSYPTNRMLGTGNRYDHYSFGKLIEFFWGGTGIRNSANAANPTEFLA